MGVIDRRRFIFMGAAGGLGLAAIASPAALAATDDELAFANFGVATELLLKDFYAQVGEAKLFTGSAARSFARGEFCVNEHVGALSGLLTGAGQTAPAPEDFAFAWPEGTFASGQSASEVGLTIVGALRGAYLTAAAASPTQSFRVLYASLAASCGEQFSLLSSALGHSAIGNSFPAAVDLEAASAAVEGLLG
jgi:hypothetical protein